MGGDTKKAGKGSPKLKRSARARTKYALQFVRTFKNKLRRVRKHNGERAALAYTAAYAAARTPAVERKGA